MNYSRSWPKVGHIHSYVCYKRHSKRSSIKSNLTEFAVIALLVGIVILVGALNRAF
jgi:hypothetical protein